jgi:hypothetical protein
LHAELSLLNSTVRISPLLKDGGYARVSAEDDRFVDYRGTVQQIVTSGGTNDSGMFEQNLKDERPLPCDGAGVDSTWRLDLPTAFPAFDRGTISDVVLHLRFTARQGGQLLAAKAIEELEERLADASNAGLSLLFSLRHDFPTEWAAFANGDQNFAVEIRKQYFPFMVQGRDIALDAVDVATKVGTKLSKRAVLTTAADQAALTALADGLNGTNAKAMLSIAPDATVLRRAASEPVYLVIRYHIAS